MTVAGASCQCSSCDCDATTPDSSGVCYSCRGGAGVALAPFPPAHHRGHYGDRLEAWARLSAVAGATIQRALAERRRRRG